MKVSFYAIEDNEGLKICSREMDSVPRIGEIVYYNVNYKVIDVKWEIKIVNSKINVIVKMEKE